MHAVLVQCIITSGLSGGRDHYSMIIKWRSRMERKTLLFQEINTKPYSQRYTYNKLIGNNCTLHALRVSTVYRLVPNS